MRILFLEDEPTIREVLTEYMKMQNYDVTCAGDGGQALDFLAKRQFDMAVLDIMMPEVSGSVPWTGIEGNGGKYVAYHQTVTGKIRGSDRIADKQPDQL